MTDTAPETLDTTSEVSNSSTINVAAVKAIIDKRKRTETSVVQDKLVEIDEMLDENIVQLFLLKQQAYDVFTNDQASITEKDEAAEAYRQQMTAAADFFGNGLVAGSTVPSGPELSLLQQQAVIDVGTGRLFQHPSGAWGDREWSARRPTPASEPVRAATPVPAPPVPPTPPAPASTDPTPEPSSDRVAPSSDDAGSSESTTPPAGTPSDPAPSESDPASTGTLNEDLGVGTAETQERKPVTEMVSDLRGKATTAASTVADRATSKGRGWGIGPNRNREH